MRRDARLEELYEDHILQHFESPYHKGRLARPSYARTERNATCGDQIELQLKIQAGRVVEAYFEGQGCAISQAAASLLCGHIEGRAMGELECFEARDMLDLIRVPLTPYRQRCGLLVFRALKAMIYSFDSSG